MCVLYVIQPSMLNFLNYKIYDQQLRRHHSTKHSGVPVIVDIDEKSLAALGQWPWPRYRMALLLEKIRLAGALAVGLDMVLAEPDRTSPARLRTQLKRELKVDVEFSGLPKALEDNDAVLANVLRGKPYVLGFYFSFSRDELATLPRMDDELLKPAKATIASAPDAMPAQEALHTARGTVSAPYSAQPCLSRSPSSLGFVVEYFVRVYHKSPSNCSG